MIQFITYSTPGRYRKLAENMIRSAAGVGVDVQHYKVPAFPNWKAALYHKVRVIRRAFADHPGADICWIDADAEFRDHPVLLYRIPPQKHVAAYADKCDGGWVLWGGTLWMRRSSLTDKILDAWDGENAGRGDGYLDDNNLFHVIMEMSPGAFFHLPPAYCWVPSYFRQRFPGGKPVITQGFTGMSGNQKARERVAKIRPWMG